MTTDKKVDVMHLLFVVGIIVLIINLIMTFTALDLIYLIFIIGCYIKFIMIRRS